MDQKAKLVALTKESDSPFDILSQSGIGDIRFAKIGDIAVTNISLLSKYLGVSSAILNNFTSQYSSQFLRLGMQYVRNVDQVENLYQQLEESDRGAKASLTRYNVCKFLSRRCVFILALIVKSKKGEEIREKALLPKKPMSIQDIWRSLGFDPDPIGTTISTTKAKSKIQHKDVNGNGKAKVPIKKSKATPRKLEVRETVQPTAPAIMQVVEEQPESPATAVFAPNLLLSINSLPLHELIRLRRDDAKRFRELADRLDAEANVLEDADQAIKTQFGGWYEIPS